MIKKFKQMIKRNAVTRTIIIPVYRMLKFICKFPKQLSRYRSTKKVICAPRKKNRIYYIGIPAHNNLGDLAQGVCIRKWLNKHFVDHEVIEIETNAIVNTPFSVKKHLKDTFCDSDFIVFQSGYTTTDLGGYADEMHCTIIRLLPHARILMMPQTIFFQSQERKENTSLIYNSAKKMLFLARDNVSFSMAKQMFPDLTILPYPDIVTTLIGQLEFSSIREGILFCCRDDSEKYYSDEDINDLMKRCSDLSKVERTDTTKNIRTSEIVKNAEKYIMAEIEHYSKYRLIVTDRYHGTIFSLIAGTPVIIIKTTDHKVTTGAEWFRGIYDDHVFLAQSLDEVYDIAKEVFSKNIVHKLEPYFENEYYDKLSKKFSEVI